MLASGRFREQAVPQPDGRLSKRRAFDLRLNKAASTRHFQSRDKSRVIENASDKLNTDAEKFEQFPADQCV
jgi:hypothetical protein